MLLDCGIAKVIMVFDGAPLPIKAEVNNNRRNTRQKHFDAGIALMHEKEFAAAKIAFQKSIQITPLMVYRTVEAIKKMPNAHRVECITAPYEGDAQMTDLVKKKIADVAISEDSDLLAYGCPSVFYKMNKDGDGDLITLARVLNGQEPGIDRFQLKDWTQIRFLEMCIFTGCDYCKNIDGIGIINAYKLMQEHKTRQCALDALLKTKHCTPEYAGNAKQINEPLLISSC